MRLATVITVLALGGLVAACGDEPETRATSEAPAAEAPGTASGGATSGVDTVAPKGERIEKPLAPPQTSQTGAEDKPDPGDANDHSTPQHDAKTKSSGD